MGVFALSVDGGSAAYIPVGIGVAFIGSAFGSARDGSKIRLPDGVERSLQMQTPEYQAAFRSAWVERLRHKRQLTTIIGAVTGTGVGVLLSIWLMGLYN